MSRDLNQFDWDSLAVDAARITAIVNRPAVVGYWVLYPAADPKFKFAMYHKPTPDQIINTEQLLGWGWEDSE